jgi:hypothetical protein
LGLRLEQFITRTVHGYALEICVDGSEQADDFHLRVASEDVKRPGTIFAAAPGEQDFPFGTHVKPYLPQIESAGEGARATFFRS